MQASSKGTYSGMADCFKQIYRCERRASAMLHACRGQVTVLCCLHFLAGHNAAVLSSTQPASLILLQQEISVN
jgi:hypothetical protein